METSTEEKIITLDELMSGAEGNHCLIYVNTDQVNRTYDEVRTRCLILNRLNDAGLTRKEIEAVTSSDININDYIFRKFLEAKPLLKQMHAEGAKVEPQNYPDDLLQMKSDLHAFKNIRMYLPHSSKFENIIFTGHEYKVNESEIESSLIKTGCKVLIESDKLAECRDIADICRFLMKYKFPGHQLRKIPFLNQRIDWRGEYFFPRWTHFNL